MRTRAFLSGFPATTLRWAVGVLLAFLGALAMVSPRELHVSPFAGAHVPLSLSGAVVLLLGLGLVAATTFRPRRSIALPLHVLVALALAAIAADRAASGKWIGLVNYTCLSLAVAIAAARYRRLLPAAPEAGEPPRRSPHHQLFALAMGASMALCGAALLLDIHFRAVATYRTILLPIPWVPWAFLACGAGILVLQVQRAPRPAWVWCAHVATGLVSLFFLAAVALPNHSWPDVAFYGGLAPALAILPALGTHHGVTARASLRTQLAMLLTTATLIAVVLAVGVVTAHEQRRSIREASHDQRVRVSGIADDVAGLLSNYRANLLLLRHDARLLGKPKMPLELTDFLSRNPSIRGIEILDRDGRTIAAQGENPQADQTSSATLSWVSAPQGPPHRANGEGKVPAGGRRSRPSSAASNGAPAGVPGPPGVRVVLTTHRGGAASWRVRAFLDLSGILDALRGPVPDERYRLLDESDGTVLQTGPMSGDGHVLADTARRKGAANEIATDGRRFVAAARIEGTNWILVAEREAESVLAPVSHDRLEVFLLLLLVLALAVPGGILAARRVVHPLERLSFAVGALGRGEAQMPLPTSRIAELASLSEAFGEMRARLAASARERDDLERRLRERAAALRKSEVRFRGTFQNAAVGLANVAADGRFLLVNRRLREILGRSEEELLGSCLHDLVSAEDAPAHLELWSAIARGERNDFCVELQLQAQEGRSLWAQLTATLLRDADGQPLYVLCAVEEISARKRAEQELERSRQELERLVERRTNQLERSHQRLRLSERLAAVGTLAAGLGHDMGNIVFPLRCRIEALEEKEIPAEVREELVAVLRGIEYLEQLSEGLRYFALDPEDEGASGDATDLAEWWTQVRPLLVRKLPKNAKFVEDFPARLPPLQVPPHRLTQAIFNLITNAGEVIDPDGCVRISAAPTEEGSFVRLCVEDDGPGMPPELSHRVLEPFFTTKKRGLSTGLGLSLVHSVVRAAGGQIEIDSEPGKGTRICLLIPLLSESVAAAPADADRPLATISLQDRRIATFLSGLLSASGFEVRHSDRAPSPRASLWVTAPTKEALEAARDYLAADSRHRIVVLGDAGAEWTELGAAIIMESAGLKTMREALRRAVVETMEAQ